MSEILKKLFIFLKNPFRKSRELTIRIEVPSGYIEIAGDELFVLDMWLDLCETSDELYKICPEVSMVETVIGILRKSGIEEGRIKPFETLLEWDEILENDDEKK